MRARTVAIAPLLVACRAAPPTPSPCEGLAGSATPFVRVVVVTHSEVPSTFSECLADPDNCHPDYQDPFVWSVAEPVVRSLAETLADAGRVWSFQTDTNFAEAAVSAVSDVVVRVAELGHEVTPHTHGNRADVATWIRRAGVEPATVAGGILYAPPESADWAELAGPVTGALDPETPWQATVLWGAATLGHEGVDDTSSGVWRPSTTDTFYTDRPGNLPYVGGYTGDVSDVYTLADRVRSGGGEPGGFYTAAVMTDLHRLIQRDALPTFLGELAALDDVEDGLRWETIAETAEAWAVCGADPGPVAPE